MKNSIQKLTLILSIFLILTACKKDNDQGTEDYSFTIATTFADTGFVDADQPMTLVITPAKDIADTTYSFSFEVTGGEGIFKKDDITITVGDTEQILEEITLNYLPSTDGVHEITIKVRNSNNYEEEKQISYTVLPNIPCSFNFSTAAFAATDTPHPGITQDINFTITQDLSLDCDTAYEMSYIVKKDGLDASGIFSYEGEQKFQETPFVISTPTNTVADFTGQFTTAAGDGIGNYEVIFTITNQSSGLAPEEATQTQTASLEFVVPPVVINVTSATNTIYAKQTATYNVNLTGGGNTGEYTLKVAADDADLGATLQINDVVVDLDTLVTVDPTLTISLTPEETGDSVSFTITAIKNGTEETATITLTSEMPEFTMGELSLDPASIPLGETTSTLTIPITLSDDYTENLTYTYLISGSITSAPDASSGYDVDATPTPEETFAVGYLGDLVDTKRIEVKVTNQYGYSATKAINLVVTEN